MVQRAISFVLVGALALSLGCAKRIPVYDEAGVPISEQEIQREKKSTNLALYAIGGGALSFGLSFFLGSLASRASDDDKAILWGSTAAGATIGTVIFAKLGANRDRLMAIERIKDRRQKRASEELESERQRRARIEAEKRALEAERIRQEEERRRLLKELEKRKQQEKKP
jgi:hypothetical protein